MYDFTIATVYSDADLTFYPHEFSGTSTSIGSLSLYLSQVFSFACYLLFKLDYIRTFWQDQHGLEQLEITYLSIRQCFRISVRDRVELSFDFWLELEFRVRVKVWCINVDLVTPVSCTVYMGTSIW